MKLAKFTPGVLAQVVLYRDSGLSSAEIAKRIGCTVGTLRVKCSHHKISLRRPGGDPEPCEIEEPPCSEESPRLRSRRQSRGSLTLSLPKDTVDQLRQRAAEKGISGSRLAANLLEAIARDGLYEAVLDDD